MMISLKMTEDTGYIEKQRECLNDLRKNKADGKAGDKPMFDTGALYNDFDYEVTSG